MKREEILRRKQHQHSFALNSKQIEFPIQVVAYRSFFLLLLCCPPIYPKLENRTNDDHLYATELLYSLVMYVVPLIDLMLSDGNDVASASSSSTLLRVSLRRNLTHSFNVRP